MEGTLIRDRHKDTLLYAGQLRVRITDWFFLKDEADLKYIGLEDAVVKMQRTDSVWNYQFIADYFSSPTPKTNKKSAIKLNLKKVDLKNIFFVKNDNWRGERLTGKVGSMLMDAENIDFASSTFTINSVAIDNPYFSIENNIPELRPSAIKKALEAADKNAKDTGLRFNPGVTLHLDKLSLNNGTFVNTADNDKPTAHFDGSHIVITQLNGSFTNLVFNKDTLTARVNISAKERCGLNLKKLKAHIRFTPQIMEFSKLDLETNKSKLSDYYAMKFKHFNNDFANYVTNVIMEGRFKESKIFSDDVAFFAPDLKPWKKEVTMSGTFNGTVSDFNIRGLFARSANAVTTISGDLGMKGLPYIDKTVIKFNNGTIRTNYNDLSIFMPPLAQIKEPNLAALGTILFRGNFNGTINDFKTTGNISSNIGGISADVTMKLPKKQEPSYSGSIVTNRFNLGKFLDNDQVGLIDFNGKLTGTGLSLGKGKMHLDGDFAHFEFHGYNYSDINAVGDLIDKKVTGEFKINDSNFNFTSNISIDFNKDDPSFNVLGDLVKCDFKKINLTPDNNFALTGLFDLDFTGGSIDGFLGTAKILNANLTHDNNKLSFDSLILQSQIINDKKFITLSSNEFNCAIGGSHYKLLDLPNAFQSFMHHYYPAYFKAPDSVSTDQDFYVSIYTKEFDDYARIIDKRLSGLDYASISGVVDTKKNQFMLNATIPTISIDKYNITDASIKAEGNLDSLTILSDISNIKVGDSLNFPNSTVHIKSANDHSIINIETKADNTLNEALLNADLYTLEDGIRLHFNPSSFVLNQKKWNLEKEGEIVVRRNFVSAENVKFTQGFQEIKVETELDDAGSNISTLVVNLKNVFLGDITSMFIKNPQMEGLTTGQIKLHDFFGDFNAEADLKTEQFKMNEDSVGLVSTKAYYNNKTGIIKWDAISANDGYKFTNEGSYNIKDTTNNPLTTTTDLKDSKIDIIHQFIGDIFSDIRGKATGKLTIKGDPSAPILLGKVALRNASMKVNYTQVTYTIDSALITFKEDGIDFGEFTIKDKYNNTGTAKGILSEKGFKDMAFNFDLNTRKLLLIDTKAKDNKLFYGKAVGRATLSLKGPESAAKMTMVAEANDTSHIFIANSNSKESGDADFIEFKQHGVAMDALKPRGNFDLTVDLDLTANNKVDIDVILDELTGDVITAKGNGRLRIIAGTTKEASMKGRYNIESGRYNFDFQSFIRKPFTLLPDAGNYIEWNGDPLKANIHIDAQYTATNVGVSDLVSGQQFTSSGLSSSARSYRGDVFVIAELRNQLTHPDISFRLEFPQGSPIKTDPVFTQFLNTIQNNQNEMLSQATSLIVFGSFAPYGQGLLGNSAGGALNGLGVNSLTQLLTGELNKAVSNMVYKLFKTKDLHVDVSSTFYSSTDMYSSSNGLSSNANNTTLDRSSLNFKIGYNLFHDNVIISFGNNFDFGLGNTTTVVNGNFQWLPDFTIELILSQDRRLRGIAFYKNSLDYNAGSAGATLGRSTRQGIGLSYKRDFEKFTGTSRNDLIRKKKVRDSTTTNQAKPDSSIQFKPAGG